MGNSRNERVTAVFSPSAQVGMMQLYQESIAIALPRRYWFIAAQWRRHKASESIAIDGFVCRGLVEMFNSLSALCLFIAVTSVTDHSLPTNCDKTLLHFHTSTNIVTAMTRIYCWHSWHSICYCREVRLSSIHRLPHSAPIYTWKYLQQIFRFNV